MQEEQYSPYTNCELVMGVLDRQTWSRYHVSAVDGGYAAARSCPLTSRQNSRCLSPGEDLGRSR